MMLFIYSNSISYILQPKGEFIALGNIYHSTPGSLTVVKLLPTKFMIYLTIPG